ncbi:MAG: sodium-dependent dicarboxylate transporter 2/3/5 [Cryomorphaceae bacterium]|jgi:sodium-dependent dicarboxylate transporter 2/3/5
MTKSKHLLLGPCVAVFVFITMSVNGVAYLAAITAAITTLTAWWWATEALPVPATSLIPFSLFPLFGVLNHKQAAAGMGSHIILLMLGGFIMAKALERSNAHKRFAMAILRALGQKSNKQLVLAFMLTAALLSMWISNTATCLMLMPIVLACLQQVNDEKLSTPLIVSVAYACSIGGIATLIGTPPNVIFAGIYEEVTGREFGFLDWMKIGVPIVACILPIAWLWLTRNVSGHSTVDLPLPTPWTKDEKRVVIVFACIVFLWVFRTQPFGGWTGAIGASGVGDASIAMLGALAMFVVRSERGQGLLDWASAVDIPWGILLMFGAGITIAKAFFESGLADLIGVGLSSAIVGMPIYLVVLLVCLSITFFTELNSNLATTTLVLPILAATAGPAGIPLELLMIPATISASCAFMLPVATAPNAIAYATGRVSVKEMMREGFALNIMLALVISALCFFILG